MTSHSASSRTACARDQVILGEGVLERAERHTVGFARHAEQLRTAGRHIKRGMLLHGPPGTGKTLTAMYLACQMTGRTVLLMTGRGMGPIDQSCRMARLLQPSMVILEDVDRPTVQTCSSLPSRLGRAASTRQSRSRCQMPTVVDACSCSTRSVWSYALLTWTRW